MRIVVKVGSSSLVAPDGSLDTGAIERLCSQVSKLHAEGNQVIVVSSGAAAAGMGRLGFDARPDDLPTLMACCSAGQAALTETYAELLGADGIACGQVLLTRGDIVGREGYLNARGTLERLLELGAVPVVNENDAVSSNELAFGDNDTLGAIVAALVGADLLVVLSDIEGLMDADPAKDASAKLVSRVEAITPELMALAGGSSSGVGTGGMRSKLRAARMMIAVGIPMVIGPARRENVLVDIVSGEQIGTRFESVSSASMQDSRKIWIGLAGVSKGKITVDGGAASALADGGGSLLPVGVIRTSGAYEPGDVVSVVDEEGRLLGRGVSRYSADEVEKTRGLKLDVIGRFLPERAGQPLIHRDELLLF